LSLEAQHLREYGQRHGLSDAEINNCIEQVLNDVNAVEVQRFRPQGHDLKKHWTLVLQCFLALILLLVPLYYMVSSHKPTQTFVTRHIQDYIYPFMRYLRLSTLSLHASFPQITAWHEEQCLVYNPWYRNPDVGCWPCEHVLAVINLTEFTSFAKAYYQNGTPFIVKDSSKGFTLRKLENLYMKHGDALNRGTGYFLSAIPSLKHPRDIFELGKSQKLFEYSKIHIEWQFKRVSAARVLRKVFPRPYFVPNTTEVALERYLFIDGPSSPSYSLPLTEFANVWLNQKSGRRIVMLEPAPHCKSSCIPISAVLSANDILFYNWQLWRARFLPSATSLSITYMSSFY